jgi:hypothetical protein
VGGCRQENWGEFGFHCMQLKGRRRLHFSFNIDGGWGMCCCGRRLPLLRQGAHHCCCGCSGRSCSRCWPGGGCRGGEAALPDGAAACSKLIAGPCIRAAAAADAAAAVAGPAAAAGTARASISAGARPRCMAGMGHCSCASTGGKDRCESGMAYASRIMRGSSRQRLTPVRTARRQLARAGHQAGAAPASREQRCSCWPVHNSLSV